MPHLEDLPYYNYIYITNAPTNHRLVGLVVCTMIANDTHFLFASVD